MKKILGFVKTICCGILPAITGGCITLDIIYVINNIQKITTGSGWDVVTYFVLAFIELNLLICILYELGVIYSNCKKWIQYQRSITTDSNSCDCEASNKSNNTSSDHM
jgi:hypothetical protein